jgi:hypothetical protein
MRGDEPRIRVARGYLHFADTIRGFVRKAQAAHELDPSLEVNAVTSAFLGAGEAMIRDRLLAKAGSGRGFAEREIRRTLDALLKGMAARSGSRKR